MSTTLFHFTDVSPHLVFKNGINPTLWPQDVPFPPDEGKEEVQSTYGDGDNTDRTNCFSPNGLSGNLQYPAYFKDTKGLNHSLFGNGSNFPALQYLKHQQQGKGLPDVIQHGTVTTTIFHTIDYCSFIHFSYR